jgi:heme A synthase
MFFAWGLKHMIEGLVMLSALVGLVAMGGAVALSVPLWIALALYPAACSLTLLLMAAIMNFRATQTAQTATMMRQQA